MNESCRTAWASEAARALWEPRIRAIAAAWLKVEVDSVRAGIRPAALVFGKPAGIALVEVAPNRYAVGPKAQALADAYAKRDDEAIGRLLGFPTCCQEFFGYVWNFQGQRDTTLWMTEPETGNNNILGRWLGVRLVPHLPCSGDCRPTHALAEALAPLWPAQELAWAREFLSYPVKYSALHGVAIITFPVLKIVTATDYTATERVIERQGTGYPSVAPSGLTFPFRQRRCAEPQTVVIQRATDWTDNGFWNRSAMDAAHQRLHDVCAGRGWLLLDLGAGNGALLERLGGGIGIEHDNARASRGRAKQRTIVTGRIQDVSELLAPHVRFDVALLSRRRLEELSSLELSALRIWLRGHVGRVLLYSYDDDTPPQLVSVDAVVHQSKPKAA